MDLQLFFVGVLMLAFGALNLIKPDNWVVVNMVRPREWQRNPAAAAEKQRRKVRRVGYAFSALGTLFLVGGVLA
ncbi:hypothetical protein ACFQJC_05285 [Haloferax namakaokahaiae]|uniref:Uncharacterized protein n=1 Tax=Haloferax namakaokahaiae TaxID=1748331 RepID=A0ABD5ZCM8_9EURY